MKLRRLFGSLLCGLLLTGAGLFAADAAPEAAGKAADGTASAAVGTLQVVTPIVQHARGTEFVEFLVNKVLVLAGERTSDSNTLLRYGISALFLVLGFLLRKVITNIVFAVLKRFASKTETTLDDKLFHALETPMATFVFVLGMVCSVKALVLSADADRYVGYLTTVVFSLLLFWGLLKAFNTILDHMHEAAKERELGIAAFMPLIKKVLIAIFIIFGGLLIAQSLGADVKAFLAGLGIGGLAFALAAQDTIANLFGSLVVALDQPFKVAKSCVLVDTKARSRTSVCVQQRSVPRGAC
jgi:MscS family membrane protein